MLRINARNLLSTTLTLLGAATASGIAIDLDEDSSENFTTDLINAMAFGATFVACSLLIGLIKKYCQERPNNPHRLFVRPAPPQNVIEANIHYHLVANVA